MQKKNGIRQNQGDSLIRLEFKMKYNIGDRIKDDKRDFVITKSRKYNDRLQYQYKCNICGYDCSNVYKGGKYISSMWYYTSQISRGSSCSCCSRTVIAPEINSIYVLRKDLLPFFKNIEDAKKYTINSNVSVTFKCPDCGAERIMKLPDFIKKGFICPKCSDKISIGEKTIYCILDFLNVNFIKEASKKTLSWAGNYRYDFYLPDYNTIIEVHGKQHYSDNGFASIGGKTLQEEIKNDKKKFQLAMDNDVENYIIIDARKSELQYIKNSILSSKLNGMFDLSFLDWNYILQKTINSLVKEICLTWKNNPTISMTEISQQFHLDKTTILKYLRIGNDLGWCKFDDLVSRTEHYDRPYKNDAMDKSTPILCTTNNIYFKSICLCSKNSEELFGRYIGTSTIRHLLKHKKVRFKKVNFDFEYITKEDFNNAIINGCQCYGTPFLISK
jgi:hypothetical protein